MPNNGLDLRGFQASKYSAFSWSSPARHHAYPHAESVSAKGQKRTLKKRKPECPNYPLARQSSILSAASSQASANSKNSFLAAGSSAALAKRTYAANSES